MKKVFFCLALVLLSGSLSACSGVKKKPGLENSAPDEFLVTSRAPLSLPPEYDLRPVTDGSSVSPALSSRPTVSAKGKRLCCPNFVDSG